MPDASKIRWTPEQAALLCRLLATHVPGAEVWAYGSRVTGGAHEGSDLDLLLRHPGGPSLPVTGADALREALQASALPMLVDVHDAASLPPRFLDEIARAHVVVQVAGGEEARSAGSGGLTGTASASAPVPPRTAPPASAA